MALIQDAADILDIQNQGWMETYIPIIGEEKILAAIQKRTVQGWENNLSSPNTVTFVVENNENKIIGFAGCGRNREDMTGFPGELYAIYVLKDSHQAGYGKALFQACLDYLQSNHLTPFVVWAFKDNSACRFYEKMGGKFIKTKPSHTDPSVLENCYGFKN